MFGAFAVLGVATSLAYQAQQIRLSQLYHVRGVQGDLLKEAMNDPELASAVDLQGTLKGVPTRQHLFVLRYFHYLFLAYEGGVASATSLGEEVFPSVFKSAVARRFWEFARSYRHSGTRHERSFAMIADEGYRHAVSTTPASTGRPPALKRRSRWIVPVAGVAAAAVAGWMVGRRRDQRPGAANRGRA